MTAGVAVPPERPARRTHRTAATEAAETAAGRTASVVAAAPVWIMIYDADGNRCRHRCPRWAATADVMMTMAGKRGGEATARRWRVDYKTTTRQQGYEGNQLWRHR